MIWHETANPAVVVMLTQIWEAGRDKCFQYFPENLTGIDELTINDEDEFGDGFKATVKLLSLSEDEGSRSTIRKMALTVGDEEKIVWHFLFSGWPDFCVPEGENQAALLRLIKLSEEHNVVPEKPRIVHCSAGVGRSGTFIALDHLLQELEDGSIEEEISRAPNIDPIFETVNKLREQRMTMVQSESQLVFIYQVLKEQWLKKKSATTVNGDAEQNGVHHALETTGKVADEVTDEATNGVVDDVDPRPPGAFPED
jgi:protein-tyrosine phosphatase